MYRRKDTDTLHHIIERMGGRYIYIYIVSVPEPPGFKTAVFEATEYAAGPGEKPKLAEFPTLLTALRMLIIHLNY